jgi:glycosyltransferase involved in cell wall biosynthesis
MEVKMKISIILCTHNRASLLKDALGSLRAMIVPAGCTAELIIVDNASTDDTASVIKKFSRDYKMIPSAYLFEPRLGKTYALNRGIKEAKGDIIALVDDDHIVSTEYLNAIDNAISQNPEFSLFCGRVIPDWDGTEPRWLHDRSVYPIRPFPIPCFDLGDSLQEIVLKKGMSVPGAGNLIIRKSVFRRIGEFSERLGPKGHNLSGGEDIELVKRALKYGERLLYVPHVMQYHQVDPSKFALSYLIKKAYYRSVVVYEFSGLEGRYHICRIPVYLYRQAVSRLLRSLFALSRDARRYYLVRLAATLGAMQGMRKSHQLNREGHLA